mgnify:FL=1
MWGWIIRGGVLVLKKLTTPELKKKAIGALHKTKQAAAKEGKESFQKRHNLPPMSDRTAKSIQAGAFGTFAGITGKRAYDTEKKKAAWRTKKPPEMAKGDTVVKNYARGGDVRPAMNEYRAGDEVREKNKPKRTKLAGQPYTKGPIPVWRDTKGGGGRTGKPT